MSFFEELKRRNVFRVGIAYALMGWVLLQGADFALDLIGSPDWVIRVFALAVIVGLPIALIFAWAFEMTPEGIRLEKDVDRSESITPKTGRKLNSIIIGILAVIIVLMAVERLYYAGDNTRQPPQATSAETGPAKSIAVLPFADLSQAQDQGWFADGLAEEILNALVKVPDLQVASRTSAFQFKGSKQSIGEIAAELGVAHVLEGSVRSGGNRIRVTAQLIRASDGFHLWSENYDRDFSDMIGIQEDLARNIATALETSMDPGALAEMARAGTDSIEAYQEYLRGLQLQAEAASTMEGAEVFRQAYEHFERARAIDPGFAEAQVQAADYWKVELTPTRTDTGTSGLQPLQMLREYNERIGLAIQNAKSEGDRLRSLADRAMVDLRLNEARRLFEQYLEIRPNDEGSRFALSTVVSMLSEHEADRDILAHWKVKGATDQTSAFNFINQAYRSLDASQAADFGLKALQRWPNSTHLVYQTHRTLMWAGRFSEASELAARYESLVPGGSPLVRAREACGAGDREAAEKIITGLGESGELDVSYQWLLNNLLGNTRDEIKVLRPLEHSGVPYQLASFLSYHKFDPRPYPSLMSILGREGVQRPPPAVPPFRCPPAMQPSIAVLPFVNMSADAEQEYFSDGITEEIINALVRVPGLKVAARTSVFALKGKQQDIRATGSDLNVSHVLEGSVRSEGRQLRITAQLIQVEDGFHLWSESFDRERVNVFAIQEEIARAIAEVLTEQLAAPGSVAQGPHIDVRAYDEYLRGRAHLRARSEEDLAQAMGLFRKVTDSHPDYAPAWAALAITADVLDDHATAERAAQRALDIDPDNVDALNALGAVYRDTWRWTEAEAMFDRALAIDPDSTELLEDYAEFLGGTGRVAKQLEVAARGYAIDPYLDPLVGIYAQALITAGQNARAVEVADRALARGGTKWLSDIKIMAWSQSGDVEAMRALIQEMEISEAIRSAALGALDDPGNPELRAALHEEWQRSEFNEDFAALFVPLVLMARIGDNKFIVDGLLKRFSQDEWGSTEYWFMPQYDGIRAHPSFGELLELTGLPEYWDQAGWPEFCERGEGGITCHKK